jgi:putative ABC transport system permease protein
VFDLAGVYPLKMNVAGVLLPTGTPDDLAVFIDIKSAWIIQGLGHGHQDLAETRDPTLVIAREGNRVVGSAKVIEYQEITADNRDSFHFHGDPSGYPVTGGLIVPDDARAGTLLLGRFVEAEEPFQIVRPRAIVAELMETIFRIKGILDGAVAVVAVAAVLALALVFALSFRLRAPELRTNFELGASRGTTARLLGAELVILVATAALLVGLALVILERFIPLIVRSLFVT